MKVFISHKSEDTITAEKHAKDLKTLGFDIYFDKYDPKIIESNDRALHIKKKINESTDLLVVITSNTKESWWVPFEIGLSTFADIRIASIVYENSPPLPSFIKKWPIIDTDEKYKQYLVELQKSKQELLLESRSFSKSFEGLSPSSMRKSELFHRILMTKYGQM